MWPFTKHKSPNTVSGLVYLPSGTRLEDKDMQEDWTSGGVRSQKLRMLFRPRKPTSLYRFNKDGLPAAKAESVYVFNTPDTPLDRDLSGILHLEASYEAAKAGQNDAESEITLNNQIYQRILLVASLVFLAACGVLRLTGFTIG